MQLKLSIALAVALSAGQFAVYNRASEASEPGAPAVSAAKPSPTKRLPAKPKPSAARRAAKIVLNITGDVAYPDGWGGHKHIDKAKSGLFALVQGVLNSGDLNFANIECPLTASKAVVDKTYPITCKPQRAHYFVDAGFNLLSLANNHARDAGQTGINDTLATLSAIRSDKHPLWWAGTGQTSESARGPTMLTPKGKTEQVAFFALANSSPNSTVDSINDPRLHERITAASKASPIVIVSVHYGPEYEHIPWKRTVNKYHGLIDAGADLVVAHHPHVVQGVERYNNGVIFYSLGNFSFGSRTRRHLEKGARLYSLIGRITFRAGSVFRAELVPLYANNSAKWTLGEETMLPRHATPQLLYGAYAQAALDEMDVFTAQVPGAASRAEQTKLIRIGDRSFIDMGTEEFTTAVRARLIHSQLHEYAPVVAAGAAPRRATEREKKVKARAGTPLHYRPSAKEIKRKKAKARAKSRSRAKRKARSKRASRRRADISKRKARPAERRAAKRRAAKRRAAKRRAAKR